MSFSIVIPVYKNKTLFLQNLAHNYRFIKKQQVIVVDDASGEDISEAVRKKYPDITIIENAQNMGFARTVNIGSKQATGDILILFNSDVKIINDFTPALLQRFKEEVNTFAVSFIQIEKDKTEVGKNVMEFSRGLPHHNRSEKIIGINLVVLTSCIPLFIGKTSISPIALMDRDGRLSSIQESLWNITTNRLSRSILANYLLRKLPTVTKLFLRGVISPIAGSFFSILLF